MSPMAKIRFKRSSKTPSIDAPPDPASTYNPLGQPNSAANVGGDAVICSKTNTTATNPGETTMPSSTTSATSTTTNQPPPEIVLKQSLTPLTNDNIKKNKSSKGGFFKSNMTIYNLFQRSNPNNNNNNLSNNHANSSTGATTTNSTATTSTTIATRSTTTITTAPTTTTSSNSETQLGRRWNSANNIKLATDSSNKTVISTSLPPYEIEVTVVDGQNYIECPLCVLLVKLDSTPYLRTCGHRTCLECMQRYLKTEINHSRLNIKCPICSEPLSPSTIRRLLRDDKFYTKYQNFMLRKVLAAEPDARWCPAPDCGYAVIANGCASCPRLVCGREGCNTAFCYHCKQEWHPNQTCSTASIQRNKRGLVLDELNISDLIEESIQSQATTSDSRIRKTSKSSQQSTIKADDIKECPVCSSRIVKMNDGSCNHMTCSICETEFCWLCMKEISDLHYFSPSGCTFWGKKPWSRKKKLLWRLGMLVGAPICIVFIAGIAVPAIVIGIPVWAGRRLHTRLERKQFSKYRKNAIITGGVLLSFLVSPIISAMALAIGIPILLGYVYGVVPLSLCRSSGGCLSSSPSVENIPQNDHRVRNSSLQANDVISIDTATSHKIGNPSIGETSLYMSNISLETNSIGHVTNVEREDRESASNAALAGSIISQTVDDGNSTRALAGSIISKESGYTLIPAEVHSQQVTSESVILAPLSSTRTPSNRPEKEASIKDNDGT